MLYLDWIFIRIEVKPILKIALVDDEQEYLDGMGKLCSSFGRSAGYPV